MEIQNQALNGLAQAQQQLAASAERVAAGPLDAVNLAREALEQKQALRATEANIQVLKAEDELLDNLFDQRA
jgi:flagellar basal body rod protein FlgC